MEISQSFADEILEVLKRAAQFTGIECTGEYGACKHCNFDRNRLYPFITKLEKFMQENSVRYTAER